MPVLDDAIGVGVLGTELDDDGSIRGTFGGGCILRCSMLRVGNSSISKRVQLNLPQVAFKT